MNTNQLILEKLSKVENIDEKLQEKEKKMNYVLQAENSKLTKQIKKSKAYVKALLSENEKRLGEKIAQNEESMRASLSFLDESINKREEELYGHFNNLQNKIEHIFDEGDNHLAPKSTRRFEQKKKHE